MTPHAGAPGTLRVRGDIYCLSGARVAASLLDAKVAADAVTGRDGFALTDIMIDGRTGFIREVRPHAQEADLPERVELRGRHVSPAFIDLHAHLDKGHIWHRCPNPDGTHAGAAGAVARDRASHWNEEDIAARFDFALRCAEAHGTRAIRTHIDSYDPVQARRGWAVLTRQQALWAGRIAVQGVALTRIDTWSTPEGRALAAIVARTGGCLGGILKTQSGADLDACLDRLFALATEYGLDVDLHVDETLDPAADGLDRVARAVLRARFAGRVTCGHCCALAMQDDARLAASIAAVKAAGITIVALPAANLYLQDRMAGRTPRLRGLAPVQELADAHVPVAIGGDNCRDPFTFGGDHDMLDIWRDAVRIGHLDLLGAAWAPAVTALPAEVMGLPHQGRITAGARADLILFQARTFSELLARPQVDRELLRGGRPIAPVLPDYAELDVLAGLTPA
ncbi:cytosine deaminase [Sphingomonas sp.]|uniref:cytosine deaminase n=1 Tax=Sphingomonas sp. TaxID=28214 RepID=UPI0031DC833C